MFFNRKPRPMTPAEVDLEEAEYVRTYLIREGYRLADATDDITLSPMAKTELEHRIKYNCDQQIEINDKIYGPGNW